jgi:hypothetical protein
MYATQQVIISVVMDYMTLSLSPPLDLTSLPPSLSLTHTHSLSISLSLSLSL